MKNGTIPTNGTPRGLRLALLAAMVAAVAWSANLGPDSFGYVANDSTPYSFVDISSTGVAVLAGADDDKAQLNLGFPFLFYGQAYSSVCVSSNGLLSFGGCSSDFANQDLTATKPAGDYPTIAPLWFDLTFAARGAGAVYYQTLGAQGDRRFVIQWQNAYPLNGSKGITFQAILHEAGDRILFQYLDVSTGAGSPVSMGGAATIGIRDAGGQGNGRRLQWSYKVPVVRNAMALLFTPAGGALTLTSSTLWAGLKNSDDQGTQFDIRAELYKNGTLVASGVSRCTTGLTRNASLAKQISIPFGPVTDGTVGPGNLLSLKILTRIGTNPDGSKCSGHSNAVGLRLYYDSSTQPSRFGAQIPPDPLKDYFLHTSGSANLFDTTSPTGSSAKYKDSTAVNFAGGNPWKEVGAWNRTVPSSGP